MIIFLQKASYIHLFVFCLFVTINASPNIVDIWDIWFIVMAKIFLIRNN